MKTKLLKINKSLAFFLMIAFAILINTRLAKAADGELTAMSVVTGKEDIEEFKYEGTAEYDESKYETASVVELTTKSSGILRFYYQGDNTESVSIYLYDNEDLDNYISMDSISASSQEDVTDGFKVPKAGTYYVKIRSYQDESFDFTLAADIYSADDQTLKSGKSTLFSLLDSKDENYYKFTTTKSGKVKIYTSKIDGKDCYIDVSVFQKVNGKMKLVVPSRSEADGSAVGLSKGTYYIKVSGGSSYQLYSIKYTFTAITDKSGSTKAKASKMTLGKASTGLVLVSDKKSKEDWYKVTLTKTKAVTLTVKGEVSDSITITFYNSKGSEFGSLYLSEYTTEDAGTPYDNYSKKTLSKGTYYIKVTKDENNSSGSYSITLK